MKPFISSHIFDLFMQIITIIFGIKHLPFNHFNESLHGSVCRNTIRLPYRFHPFRDCVRPVRITPAKDQRVILIFFIGNIFFFFSIPSLPLILSKRVWHTLGHSFVPVLILEERWVHSLVGRSSWYLLQQTKAALFHSARWASPWLGRLCLFQQWNQSSLQF